MTVAMEWVRPTQHDDYVIAKPGEPVLNTTAFTARQKASGYVGSTVSHMMGSGEPALLFSQRRLVWRVPILLTSPTKGNLGIVGSLDVDARTGQFVIPTDFVKQIEQNAHFAVVRKK